MLYASFTFWLLVIVLSAWGAYRAWCGMVRPKIVNVVLLPGTLVAQLGHVLGLLVTGAKVTNTALVADGQTGEPETSTGAEPKIPLIGPIIIALLPLLACGTGMFVATEQLGRPLLDALGEVRVPRALPDTVAAGWQLIRDVVTLEQSLVQAAGDVLDGSWQLVLFVYLAVCLTVRMAPLPGTFRGSLLAVLVVGAGAAAVATFATSLPQHLDRLWPVLTLTVAAAVFVLVFSALIRGIVGLVKLLMANA